MSPPSHHPESQPEMLFVDVFMWTSICVCLPLTTLVIFWVCCVVRREQVPIIYYINLLISSLIQFIMIIFLKHEPRLPFINTIYMIGLMTSVYFRMCIAMERCFVITRPQSNWIRQTGKSVSVLIWSLCIIIVTLSIVFLQVVPLFVLALLPAPPFILFSVRTFKVLPAATSVPTEEKRRIVGTLVLLFIQYFLMIFSPMICVIATMVYVYNFAPVVMYITLVLFLLSPYVDLILVFFMRKGSIDKLLSCLCCCITDDTAADVAGHQQPHELMLQRERETESNCVKTVEKLTKHEPLQILL